ncbi:MAG: NFACT family protein [Pseudothermotoga sp.]|nr:NFACT family protein [Pseudothermotoga sp.]
MIDAFVLRKLVFEFSNLRGETLRQIHQSGQFCIYLIFQHATVRICVESGFTHVCLAEKEDFSNQNLSTFVTFARARLRNARLKDVRQVDLDRIVCFTFDKIDETGNKHEYELYVELFGSRSNLILVENGLVLDDFRSFVEKNNAYVLKPTKVNLLEERELKFEGNTMLSKYIVESIAGFSKLTAQEVLQRAFVDDKPLSSLNEKEKVALKLAIVSIIDDFEKSPCYVYEIDGKRFVFAYPLKTLGEPLSEYSSVSRAVDEAYNWNLRKTRMDRLRQKLLRVIDEQLKKQQRLLDTLLEELKECEKAEIYKRYGELLKYVSEKDRKGEQVLCVDWETNQTVVVPLMEGKNVKQSAQMYFERYKKLREKDQILRTRIQKLQNENQYLEQMRYTVEAAETLEDLEEIEEELAEVDLIQKSSIKREKTQKETKETQFRKFIYDGFTILVGKNNKQNEALIKKASDSDVWLHVQQSPGAHVVIRTEGRQVPEHVLLCAASIAVYYSKARYSSNVPVDYTLIKNVHKPKGSPPGMVLYTNYETVFVNPLDPESIKIFE